MFVDETEITLEGGHGGSGKLSFGHNTGADGGNGGAGGNIYLLVTSDLKVLGQYPSGKVIKAEDGKPGDIKRISGKNGKDTEVRIPVGSAVIDNKTGEELEFNELNQRVLYCRGGKGGWGNYEFKSSRNTTSTKFETGLPGEMKKVRIILKILAKYGLIGLPNAGKSSILNELTKANAGVGAYPFTTLEANLGVFRGQIIADIPGLIEGASLGRGLGDKFLKHIEKVAMLWHCLSADSEDIIKDFQTVNSELGKFDPELLKKARIILLTKTDLVDKKRVEEQTKKLQPLGFPIFPVSIYDWDSIKSLEEAFA